MNITMSSDVATKLRTLLKEEGDDAVVRVRETKIGSACKSKIVLRLSIDEREDDDVEAEIDSMPFVASQEVIDQYGANFAVAFDDQQAFDVQAVS